jgi:hypothetical protein
LLEFPEHGDRTIFEHARFAAAEEHHTMREIDPAPTANESEGAAC